VSRVSLILVDGLSESTSNKKHGMSLVETTAFDESKEITGNIYQCVGFGISCCVDAWLSVSLAILK